MCFNSVAVTLRKFQCIQDSFSQSTYTAYISEIRDRPNYENLPETTASSSGDGNRDYMSLQPISSASGMQDANYDLVHSRLSILSG